MMKKIISLAMASLLALSCNVVSLSAAAAKLQIDGQIVTPSEAPINENGRTLVPLRFIAETLGADVEWDGVSKATVTTAAYTCVFTIGSTQFTVNGSSKRLDVPARLENGRTMIPLRAISEAIGAEVDYNSATNTATVDYFTTMSGSVKITGSTTLQPIAQAAADKLNGMNSGLSISVAGGGSGAGVNDTTAGTNNIGMSSRDLTPEELQTIDAIAVANDGIAVIVHPSNPVKNLTSEQAAQIFLGEIRNWADVGGANAPILVQTRETGSGTRATLEEMLLEKESVVASATPHTSSALIKQAVAAEENAIGFDSIGFVDSTVKAVSLDNVAATATSVLNGQYPMGRALYVMTKGTPSGASAMYIDYLKTQECQEEIVEKEGYIALDK